MDRPHKRDMERNKGAYKVDFPKDVLPPRASPGTSSSEPVASFPQHSCYNRATERRQEAGNHLENHLLVHLVKVKKCASFDPAIPPLDTSPGEIHAHSTRPDIPRSLVTALW